METRLKKCAGEKKRRLHESSNSVNVESAGAESLLDSSRIFINRGYEKTLVLSESFKR